MPTSNGGDPIRPAANDDVSVRPAPLTEFILKMNSRCNLACDYCYVYSMGDDSWRQQPAMMSDEVVARTADRIADHARVHQLPLIHVIFHGGEPLLGGAKRLVDVTRIVRSVIPDRTRVTFTVQTNGTLLDTETLGLLLEQNIGVGVSLDGGGADHNRHRILHNGAASYPQVKQALRRLAEPPYSRIFRGILCTVDLQNDPVGVYESLAELTRSQLDFLLPHANWSRPPPLPANPGNPTPYATWLIEVFERWYGARTPQPQVRLFESIIRAGLGYPRPSEQVGLAPLSLVVVESNGAIERVDALKSAYPGAAATGLNVFDHDFDRALQDPGIAARQQGLAALSETCRSCAIVTTCGGGNYAHRYRRGHGFANPSVYCADLMALITHIESRVNHSIERAVGSTG